MFSQLTSFANKLSLDNLQDERDITTAASGGLPAAATEEGGGVSSLFDGLSNAVSRSSRGPPAVSVSHEKISQLEMTIHDLNIDLESKSAALQAATMEVVSLREELRAQRSGAKELAARYQAQCDAAAAEAKRAGALSDRVRALQEQLDANNATCDDLRRQVAAAAADSAAEVTPKKAVKKVKKKKTAEEDGVDATSTAVAEDGARLQEMRADYEGRLAALTAQIADLERAARTAEHALGSQAGEIATQNASSSIAILSLEQSLADVKDRSKEDLELLLAKVQKLEGLAAVAEAEFRSKYAALTERNETLQEESLLLCQQLAKKETECEELVDEGKRAAMLKDAKIAELSNKLTTLTEKAKDYVKKFSEAKAQIVSIEDANRKLSEELAQTYSAKESELVKMRLQLEARDAASSMQRGSVHDLTERLAEAQRELQRSRQSAQDGQNMVEVLQRDLQEAEVTTQALRNELAQAQTACLDTERRLGAERAALLGSKDEEVTRLLESTAELKSSRDSLLAEMESLRKEKAVGDAALKSLDEYKRKAQAALKKSSETSGSLNCEISLLKQQLESVSEENRSYINAIEKERLRNEKNEALMNGLREEILQLQNSARTSEESLAIALQAASLAAQSAAMASEGRDRDEGTEAARCPTVVDHNSSQDEQILKDVNKDDLDDTFDSSISGHRGAYDVDTISGGSLEISDSVSLLPFGGKSEVTIRRNISGSTLQATLASKSGTSFEIADGLQLPLNVPDKLLYIGEITQQLENLRAELIACNTNIDVLKKDLESERVEKSLLKEKLEDCLAFLERSKKLQSGNDSAVNMEYLKNCVLHYMLSDNVNDRLRLYPVISTILKFTSAEKVRLHNCPLHVDEIAASIEIADNAWQNIAGTFSGFWGSRSSLPSGSTGAENLGTS